jgi:hypothetical protein
MNYAGDYLPGQTVRLPWSTNNKSGASITRSTDGTISVYKAASTTQTTTGITAVEDFDSLTGIHWISIALTNVFYAPHEDYAVVLSGATIDGETVNAVLGTFSIMNRSQSRLMVAGTVDTSGSAATTTFFESSDLVAEAALNNLAGRAVYGAIDNANIKCVGVIDTSSVVSSRGRFTTPAGSPLPAAFANGARFLIV